MKQLARPLRGLASLLFGEISSRFEFSKARSGLFFSELKENKNFAIKIL